MSREVARTNLFRVRILVRDSSYPALLDPKSVLRVVIPLAPIGGK